MGYYYSPWGEIRTQTEGVTNPIKYAGEYYDDELDMLYLRARYYDPQTGRFISLDAERGSIQNPMDMNRYVYCRNNPIKYVDPTGCSVGSSISDAIKAMGGALNQAQKDAQRAFWKMGADLYLRKQKGFLTSAWMLEYACQDNPLNQQRGNDSRIANLIKEDAAFQNVLNTVINENGYLNSFSESQARGVAFEGGTDLYYSIHKCSMWFSGVKQSDGSWIINVRMKDSYDYTEITSMMGIGWTMGTSLGTIANDLAVVSQRTGALVEYSIVVDFQVRWP